MFFKILIKICNNCKQLYFFQYDVNNLENMNKIFTEYSINNIIHFASFKSVSESIKEPLLYYKNNINSTLNILELCSKYNVKNLIFSSSATVYGSENSPLVENSKTGIGITNPYGQSKYIIEKILEDMCKSNIFTNIIILRYFNPVGAHLSGLIGENPNGIPNNLMPFILNVAIKNNINKNISDVYSQLKIYGNKYNTIDGTCIRDYIHVVDLANAHIKSIEYLNKNNNIKYDVFNIGTGKGTTVMEMLNAFCKINNVNIPYKICANRDGDIDSVFCDTTKTEKLLEWKSNKTLNDICRDAYNYILTSKND